MKNIILKLLCLLPGYIFSQNLVGINTSSPQTTLDVRENNTNFRAQEGIIFPKHTSFIAATQAQNSMLAFFDFPNDPDKVGIYYYDHGSTPNNGWKAFTSTNMIKKDLSICMLEMNGYFGASNTPSDMYIVSSADGLAKNWYFKNINTNNSSNYSLNNNRLTINLPGKYLVTGTFYIYNESDNGFRNGIRIGIARDTQNQFLVSGSSTSAGVRTQDGTVSNTITISIQGVIDVPNGGGTYKILTNFIKEQFDTLDDGNPATYTGFKMKPENFSAAENRSESRVKIQRLTNN